MMRRRTYGTMRPTAIALVAALLLSGCATPGYRVHIEVKPVDETQQLELVSELESTAKESGFAPLWERKEDPAYLPGVFASSYSKRLSQRPHDYDSIGILRFVSERRVTVEITNALRGMEPPVKAEIDSLADVCIARIAARVAREGISVERGPTRIPYFN